MPRDRCYPTRYRLIGAACLLGLAAPPAGGAEIFKCTDEFGNVAYLQTPCPAQDMNSPESGPDTREPTTATAEPAEPAEPGPAPTSRRENETLADCRKRYRDRIDAIDAEMRADYSAEEADAYKQRLLALTRLLRACR